MSDQKISDLQDQIDNTKDAIQDNLSLVIDRGDNLNYLADKSLNLSDHALIFNQQSKRLKWKMRLRNLKMIALIILIILIIIFVMLFSLCGFKFDKC